LKAAMSSSRSPNDIIFTFSHCLPQDLDLDY
jgi:hypothetical protein